MMKTKVLDIIKDESENAGVRKYTCTNGFGYSQFERNIADRVVKLFAIPDIMENPIKDNRIIDETFAVRFKSFIEDITVNDACSEDEKEAMLNTANRLLRYQVLTATDKEEIAYLKRVGVYDNSYLIKTYDGVEIYDDNIILFSCMKNPNKGEQPLQMKTAYMKSRSINKNRIFFSSKELALKYIENNKLKYSEKDLKRDVSKRMIC